MSNVVKWTIIVGCFVTLIALLFTFSEYILAQSELTLRLSGIVELISEFLSVAGSVLLTARRLLNNFFPSDLVTIVISITIFKPLILWIVDAAISVVHMIYK